MQLSAEEIIQLVVVATIIFLIAPLFIVLYIRQYNLQKKRNVEEKLNMALQFDAELMRTQIEVQERTMQAIASDLHDNIGQLLSLTSLTLNSIDIIGDEKASSRLESSRDLVKKSIGELRGLARLMHGEQMLEMGLGQAIQQEIDWLIKSERFEIHFNNEIKDEEPTYSKKDLFLIRLLQEIINNIVKHANATELEFVIQLDNQKLMILVRDNGVGFDTTTTLGGGLGLGSMRHRASLIEADLQIQSGVGAGTEITLSTHYP